MIWSGLCATDRGQSWQGRSSEDFEERAWRGALQAVILMDHLESEIVVFFTLDKTQYASVTCAAIGKRSYLHLTVLREL